MNAREAILASIRRGLARASQAEARERTALQAHLAAHPAGPLPRPPADLTGRFRERARTLGSTVDETDALHAVPAAVARYLAAHSLARTAVVWPELATLDWLAAGIAVDSRPGRDADAVGITGAWCAIAETGTLVLLSGAATPASVSLLPETHVAVLPASRIVWSMEDAWRLLREERGGPPRAVHFVSGPSRTADIEQAVTLGAHAPYRVHIVIVR